MRGGKGKGRRLYAATAKSGSSKPTGPSSSNEKGAGAGPRAASKLRAAYGRVLVGDAANP